MVTRNPVHSPAEVGSFINPIWLVVEPTHLKNIISSNWVHLPPIGAKIPKKYLKFDTTTYLVIQSDLFGMVK